MKIPLEEVSKDWESHSGTSHIHAVANHYNIFDDLFGLAYFYPVLPLDVGYPADEDKIYPVYRGNVLTPTQVREGVCVSHSQIFFTLIMRIVILIW